jgi:hypothetical protein
MRIQSFYARQVVHVKHDLSNRLQVVLGLYLGRNEYGNNNPEVSKIRNELAFLLALFLLQLDEKHTRLQLTPHLLTHPQSITSL